MLARAAPRDPDLAVVAGLVGDPTRARMLTALMSGRALTATELALEGEVAASTASSHLEKLLRANLVSIARQGRHRYFRLASAEVARALESLMALAPRAAAPERQERQVGPRDPGLRRARVCYDHLAGELGVTLLASLRRERWLRGQGDALAVTPAGVAGLARLGVDVETLSAARRPLCRPCLDWSERQMHLAGSLGAALLERLFALRLVRRDGEGRALVVAPRAEELVATLVAPTVRRGRT